MFLTRHRLLHPNVPHIPLSISHCWINTELEREKVLRKDFGFQETNEVSPSSPKSSTPHTIFLVPFYVFVLVVEGLTPKEMEQLRAEEPSNGIQQILPDLFKTKQNIDRQPSEEPDTEVSSISSVGITKPFPTQPLDPQRAVSSVQPRPLARSREPISNPRPSSIRLNDVSSVSGSRPGSRTSVRRQDEEGGVPLKDRDWRGDDSDGGIWWECRWEGMDGIGGTNKKGRKCFDKVRISWRWVEE